MSDGTTDMMREQEAEKEAFCKDCPHKDKPRESEPCHTCHYWNIEANEN